MRSYLAGLTQTRTQDIKVFTATTTISSSCLRLNKIMGGNKTTMDCLRVAVKANIMVSIDTRTNDKDRVRVDVVWNQELGNDYRHYAGF